MKDNNTLCFVNGWLIDHESGSIIHKETNEVKRLGEYQLKLLETLVEHAGVILTREKLTNLVWEKRVIGHNSLPNAIHALRAALEDDGKTQRVIKTIPKRGYLLEKEFCEYEEQTPEDRSKISTAEIELSPDEIHPVEKDQWSDSEQYTHNSTETKTFANTPAIVNPVPLKTGFNRKYPLYIGMFVLVLIAFAIGVFFINPEVPASTQASNFQDLSINKEPNQPYEHVNIYHISADRPDTANQDIYSVPERLKESLNKISKLMGDKNASIDVYYQATDAILHYTFSIKTRCEHEELSMNIFHWRINNERLNNLIYQETERKLNELATCNS